MRFIAVWNGPGSPARDVVHRLETQRRVRLVTNHQRGYVLEGEDSDCKELIRGLSNWTLEPCYPPGT